MNRPRLNPSVAGTQDVLIQQVDRLRRQLDAQTIRNNALINSIGEGILVIDPKGIIIQVNAYAMRALGYAQEELVGKWFHGAVVATSDTGQVIDPFKRTATRALAEGAAIREYTNLLRKDGRSIPVAAVASPIVIDGKPAGAIEVFRDLTKERELDLAKDDFVSLASHQLRTPATSLKAILHMLRKGDFGPFNERQAKYLDLAIMSNERQIRIIEDLLNVARADAGTLDLDLDYSDAVGLVREVVRDHTAEAILRQQALRLHVPKEAMAVMDGQKIRMVVDNLVSNAIKYTPVGGRIEVTLSQPEGATHIVVADTGVGIPDEYRTAVFEKFSRVHNALSAPAGGTGLGLYLARHIALLHRGSIKVESKPGKGSRFTLIIPSARPTAGLDERGEE